MDGQIILTFCGNSVESQFHCFQIGFYPLIFRSGIADAKMCIQMESQISEKSEQAQFIMFLFPDRWLPEADFTHNNPEFEAMYQFSLAKTLARTNR